MTKWKLVFRDVCKCIKNQKLKSLVYISIQTLCCHTPNVELIGHSLERHTPMYTRAHNSHCMSDWNQAMQSKELSVDLHDEIVVSHLSGPGYKSISKVLSAGRSTVALKIVSGEQPALLIAWGWLLWGASQQQRPGDWGEWWMLPNTERSLKNTCSRAQVTSDGGDGSPFNATITWGIQPRQHWSGLGTSLWLRGSSRKNGINFSNPGVQSLRLNQVD